MAVNPQNLGVAIGRLCRDVVRFDNKNGSQKVILHLAVDNNFLSRDGQRHSQFLDFEAYIPEGMEMKVYDLMHKGDKVEVLYSLRSSSYERNGETIYVQSCQIESIALLESKAVTDARRATPEAAPLDAPADAAVTMDQMAGVAVTMPVVD